MPPDPDDYRRKARYIVKLGIALHECGGSSQRVERHLLAGLMISDALLPVRKPL